MVIPYPHVLSYATEGTPSYYDEDSGVWIPSVPSVDITVDCRAIPNGSGRRLNVEDGKAVDYEFDIAFPLAIDRIPTTVDVSIVDQSGYELVKGRLLRWHPGQLHNRGWI